MWVQLTTASPGEDRIFVNLDHASLMQSDSEGNTLISIQHGKTYTVLETPEQILGLDDVENGDARAGPNHAAKPPATRRDD